jgi:hypothetical protein
LATWAAAGWHVTKVRVVSVKAWWGRYYVVVFEKGKPPMVEWFEGNF